MTALPPSIEPDDEIAITWRRNERRTKIKASLGGASVVIRVDHGADQTVPWLVAALPNILEAAWAAIENDTTNQEAP